jgi:hypothetical protein
MWIKTVVHCFRKNGNYVIERFSGIIYIVGPSVVYSQENVNPVVCVTTSVHLVDAGYPKFTFVTYPENIAGTRLLNIFLTHRNRIIFLVSKHPKSHAWGLTQQGAGGECNPQQQKKIIVGLVRAGL